MTDLHLVRSLLFLPASNPRAIAKARASEADLVILDLEDAVTAEDKDTARDAAIAALQESWSMPVAVRINSVGSDWHQDDLEALLRSNAELLVVPRPSNAGEVAGVKELTGKPVLAMIETAAGVLAAPEIAKVAEALIAGTNDLRADLRLPLDAGREPISASLQMIVLAARAAGIAVFDGVYNQFTDAEGFAAECADGRGLGFDGKSLIHPDQIDPCNRAFSPSEQEVRRARELVDAFGGGAERIGDQMIERMHVEAARLVLARAGECFPLRRP